VLHRRELHTVAIQRTNIKFAFNVDVKDVNLYSSISYSILIALDTLVSGEQWCL